MLTIIPAGTIGIYTNRDFSDKKPLDYYSFTVTHDTSSDSVILPVKFKDTEKDCRILMRNALFNSTTIKVHVVNVEESNPFSVIDKIGNES